MLRLLLLPSVLLALLLSHPAFPAAEPGSIEDLSAQREALARDLAQVEDTLALLHDGDGNPWESSNATVRALAEDAVRIKQEMLGITERELKLLQDQIDSALAASAASPGNTGGGTAESPVDVSSEAEAVKRLQTLIASYYADLQRMADTMPSPEEVARRQEALEAARRIANIRIDPGQVLLSGAEGNVVLRNMSERLADAEIPESRRDIAPICSIRTRLFGSLVASENRSLRPVGKNLYVARVRLQPGISTLRLRSGEWQVRLPDDSNAADYLVTLFEPTGSAAELHVFPVDALQSASNSYLPAWLPPDLNLAPTS